MHTDLSPKEQIECIIKEKKIYPVYQPIVSLQDGSILGYEALSRISLEPCTFDVEEMFTYAEKYNYLWNLEYVCRKKALKGAKNKLADKKLFLNVDPNIINDERFQAGMTFRYLDRYNIGPEAIVLEVCERSNIKEIHLFQKVINHYEKQDYQIAIDDFGKGYADFNRLFFLHPKYVKLDISMIRNIDTDTVKHSLVEGMVKFCHSENIRLIAEGIETKEELTQLIRLGIDYGQGYFLAKPSEKIQEIPASVRNTILNEKKVSKPEHPQHTFFGNVGSICQKLGTTTCDTKAVAVYEYMQKQPEITEICIVDHEQRVCGLLTKQHINEYFGGRYGYSLYSKYTVGELFKQDYLEVEARMPIEVVSRLALIRPKNRLYDAIVVSNNGFYAGIVTVKDLLEASVSIQVERAMDTNPLTHLPGNIQIERMISNHLFSKEKFSILYLDLDNFKSYNDAYGFENGDIMIKAIAKCMEDSCQNNEFIGHVGGDDFVIISNDYNLEEVFQHIIYRFQFCLKDLYSEEDYRNGEIHSQNRQGEPETFPLASVSGALFTNEKISVQSLNDFSYKIALTKKMSKKHTGNYLQKTEALVN